MAAEKAIEQYYKLRGRHEAKVNRAKKRILKSTGSMAEKRQQFLRIVHSMPCVGCKRSVGVVFFSDSGFLRGICGDQETPCSLDIRIKRGVYRYSPALLRTIRRDTEISKMNIIKEKLDLLFELSDEEALAGKFDELKTVYKGLIRYATLVETDMQKSTEVEVEEPGSVRNIQREQLAKINQIRLGAFIQQFKDIMAEFREAEGARTRGRQGKLNDAIELYQTQIIPTMAIIRRALYDINTVIRDKREFRLVQIKTSLAHRTIQLEPPEIIKNKK